MASEAANQRSNRHSIALVPTMGSLHQGHLSLIRSARERCERVIVSIFVNPTQFGPGEDLENYPRNEVKDIELAAEAGATDAFCPSPTDMYPTGFQTTVSVGELAKPLCGASRERHFAGVATVVTKLLNIVRPNVAIFGQKDFQQLTIIKRFVHDLSMGVEIVGMPIVREESGLALSSRNSYLSPQAKVEAVFLSKGLIAAADAFRDGQRSAEKLLEQALKIMDRSSIAIEYLELRDAESLDLVSQVTQECVLAVAAQIEKTRLIDNVLLHP